MDWESHRIVTRTGRFRAFVFTRTHSFVVRVPIGYYAARITTYPSMKKLESFVRSRGWRLEKVRHFS